MVFALPRSELNTAITPCTLRTAFCNPESRGASEDTAHITSLDTKGTERVDKIDDKIPNSEISAKIFFSILSGDFHQLYTWKV